MPSGVVAKPLAERGYRSPSPTAERVRVEDIKGSLVVIPGGLGACGVSEAIVFTGLTTIWANCDRLRPVVERTLHQLAELSWGGRVAEHQRSLIER